MVARWRVTMASWSYRHAAESLQSEQGEPPRRVFRVPMCRKRSLRRKQLALATCIMCCAAGVVAAQSYPNPEPRPQANVSADSLTLYPRLTLEQVVARALVVSPMVASGIGGV